MVIAGILAAVAIPSFKSLTQSQQVKAASFELFAAFSLARSEAIKRNGNVTVTPNAGGWQAGWSITSSGGEIIKSHGALKGSVVTNAPASVVYARSGRVNGAAPSFKIDDATATAANARCIKIELSGMPRTVKGAC